MKEKKGVLEESSKLYVVLDRGWIYFILFKVLKKEESLRFEEGGKV